MLVLEYIRIIIDNVFYQIVRSVTLVKGSNSNYFIRLMHIVQDY